MNMYNGNIGESPSDNLFAGMTIPVEVKSVKLKKGQGILLRGTVVGIETESGLAVVVDSGATTGSQNADSILTDDVDTTLSDVVATAYSSGLFNRNAIFVGGSDTAEKHETQLRKMGIYLKDNLGG